ncbi:MAG: hypothetical protein KF757_03530 [Phycisphaeraceae bacterium]|nr:hypothetical protein [Phycisphaeraceae bacterium]MCW5763075.1 hypothetical protein [Phycisphaeraceae bacterium]
MKQILAVVGVLIILILIGVFIMARNQKPSQARIQKMFDVVITGECSVEWVRKREGSPGVVDAALLSVAGSSFEIVPSSGASPVFTVPWRGPLVDDFPLPPAVEDAFASGTFGGPIVYFIFEVAEESSDEELFVRMYKWSSGDLSFACFTVIRQDETVLAATVSRFQ